MLTGFPMLSPALLGAIDGPDLLVTYDGRRAVAALPLHPITTHRALYDRTIVLDAMLEVRRRPAPAVLPAAVMLAAAAVAGTPALDLLTRRRRSGLDPHVDRRHAIEAARKAEAPTQPSAPGDGAGVSEARKRRRAARRRRGF